MEINTTIKCHSGNYTAVGYRRIEYIVMHYTGNTKDTAKANAMYFHSRAGIGASAHYFVDDNEIYQSVDDMDRAWHCGANSYWHTYCRNANSIGIEMCTSGNYLISQKTIENAEELAVFLLKKYNLTEENLLRHWDVTGKECPLQMVGGNNPDWLAFKKACKELLKGEKEVAEKRYMTVDELPAWAKEPIQYLIDKRIIADGNNLDMSMDMIRNCIYSYRLHIM